MFFDAFCLLGFFWFCVQRDRRGAALWLYAIPKSYILDQQPPVCTPSGSLELSHFPLTENHLPAAASITQYAASAVCLQPEAAELLILSHFP